MTERPSVAHHQQQDTLRLLNEHVPTDWKIHMHCFGESPEMAAQLLATYPNVYFGFTGTRSPHTRGHVRRSTSKPERGSFVLQAQSPLPRRSERLRS
jgi:TatD DNase family protein